MIRILFLAANPQGTALLDLPGELAELKERLLVSEHGEQFQIEAQWATSLDALEDMLRTFKPHIVHFSSHGAPNGDLILETRDGQRQPVRSAALAQLLRLLQDSVRCVVLNACFSAQQASEIIEVVECVIGMAQPISDAAAKAFSNRFYRALGGGDSVEKAFLHGKNGIELQALAGVNVPSLSHRPEVDPNEIKMTEKLHLFCLHADDDAKPFADFQKHLHPLVRQGLLLLTGVNDVPLNQSPSDVYDERLRSAHMLVLLVSAELLQQHDQLYRRALAQAGRSIVVPVLIRAASWESTPLAKFVVLPRSKNPIYGRSGNTDAEWVKIVREIRAVADSIVTELLKPVPPPVQRQAAAAMLAALAPNAAPNPALASTTPATPGSVQMDKRQLRNLIYDVLPADSDLQAFLIDNFPEISQMVTNGMTRNDKINLLFENESREAIFRCLKLEKRYARFAHLLPL